MANHPNLAKLLDSMVSALPGVESSKSRWTNRDAYYAGSRECVHFHSGNKVDIRLTKQLQRKYANVVKGDPRVKFRPRASEWIEVKCSSKKDVEFALSLAKLALSANRLIG